MILDNGFLIAMTSGFLVFALIQWLFPSPPLTNLVAAIVFFLGSLAYGLPRIRKGRKQLRRLRQGRDGELAVAECLDLLRGDGARVLHDLAGESFNVDHVVVAASGIYTVETKTLSKPTSGSVRIRFDGERIRIGSFEPPRNPIVQAKAQAAWLRQLVEDALGRRYDVRPVIVFPGWFVERTQHGRASNVWVLEPKGLRSFIRNEPARLSETEVATITHFLKRHIRASRNA